MSYSEALSWFSYIRKRGSLNIGTRLEAGFALLASIQINANGGLKSGKQVSMQDFMPHADRSIDNSVDATFMSLRSKK